MLVVDCGVTFPDSEDFGFEAVIPDFQYLFDNAEKIVGVLITHGHQDHIGALPHLLSEINVPIFAPRFAAALIRSNLPEHGIDPEDVQLTEIAAGETLKIGPFECEFIHMNHSIPDTLAVAFFTSVGTIFHSGDFKIDPTPYRDAPCDLARIRELGDAGVRLAFSDSTNSERPGQSGSEMKVRDALERVVRGADSRVFVTLFSTNLYRVQALLDAAYATGKKLVIMGRSLQKIARIARDLGWLKIQRDDLWIDSSDMNRYPKSQLIIAVTGSQGQEKSALGRLANYDVGGVRIEPGDLVVFSARVIPGNEHPINRMKDAIVRRGGTVLQSNDVHVSGHAFAEEQKELLSLLRPRSFVPVHGEYRFQRAHADLAESTGVREDYILANGDTLVIGKSTASVLVGAVNARKVVVDKSPFAFTDGDTMAKRRRLAAGGLCSVALVLNGDTGRVLGSPVVQFHGLGDAEFIEDVSDTLARLLEDAAGRMPFDRRFEPEAVEEQLRPVAHQFFKRELGMRPFVVVHVSYV